MASDISRRLVSENGRFGNAARDAWVSPGSAQARGRGRATEGVTDHLEMHMRVTKLIGGAAAALLVVACSDSTRTLSASDWSGAVIRVAAENPSAKGELRGVVVDSSSSPDLSTATPIPGATVVLNLKVTVQPATPSDTAWTTVTRIGEVVTDANGRFLVTSIPDGDYYLEASPPPNEPFYSNTTWAFASSGSSAREAVIYLPRRLGNPPPDSLSIGPVVPPTDPRIDSM
jgi:hypothetical protein